MGPVQYWYCCSCRFGPLNIVIDFLCPCCHTKRCGSCNTIDTVEEEIQQPRFTDEDTLHTAVQENNMDMVRQLLGEGANVNMRNVEFQAPLHIAVQNQCSDIITFLLDKGADVNMPNGNSDMPLHIAIQHALDTISDLSRHLVDADAKSAPFQVAIELAHTVKILIKAGADVNVPRRSGVMALTMALQGQLHDVVEILLEAGALVREAIKDVVWRYHGPQWDQIELEVKWRVLHFVQNELSGNVDDLRKVVALTGSLKNAQMMSAEEYVAQTWNGSGLKVLDTFIEVLRTGYAELDISAGQKVTFRIDHETTRITLQTSQEHTVDIMEQIAWFESVFTYNEVKSKPRGPFLVGGYYSFSSASQCYRLSIEHCTPIAGPCWTKILRSATLAVGFPVRKRPEGIGLEIPFPLLLRFADISVSMEYDGGTLLVGESTILFPARKLEDGIQWHVTDATSAKDAIQVIKGSPDWIRTNDIGQLAQLRVYLGYCSHAQVLLGTRELVMSQNIMELQSLLPKSKSHIELAHESTMTAGFSILGIFNTTVGGKWVIPTRLNVSLEESRDLEDLLMNSRQRPVLIYDRKDDRAWLVPELNVIVHIALTYLNQTDVRQRCLASVRETLPYLNAAAGGGLETYNAVKDHWNLELYRKLEDGHMKTFGMVIRDFMNDFQKLRTAENIRRESKGFQFTLPAIGSQSLRGWDFSELALKKGNIFQREMKWKRSGPLWTMLTDIEDMLVIMGSSFGNLIRPVGTLKKRGS